MRKVVKNFASIPDGLMSENSRRLVAQSLLERGRHNFKPETYGHESVRRHLNAIYNSKCCFCETDTSAGATLQVEHFRPKAKVTGAANHPGYYWLGYQWSNLLLACSSCNNRKRNNFPITGQRTFEPPIHPDGTLDESQCHSTHPTLAGENPQLVNPETDPDPMRHFRFLADGRIEPLTAEGEATIEKCYLFRGALVKARKKVYDNIFNKFLKHFERFNQARISEDQLKILLLAVIEDDLINYIINDENQYLEFAKTCWREFDAFFIKRFQPKERAILQTIYDELLADFDAA